MLIGSVLRQRFLLRRFNRFANRAAFGIAD
jgi:hypothetical protein